MIVASISFAALFASAMYDNISVKFDKFLEYTVGELFDVQLYIKNPAHLMQTKVLLETFPEVRKVIDYNIEYLKTDEAHLLFVMQLRIMPIMIIKIYFIKEDSQNIQTKLLLEDSYHNHFISRLVIQLL